MHESQQHRDALQSLLEASYAAAGEHLLSIHTPNWRMSADDICTTLQNVCVLDLATVDGAGRPYVAPVDGIFLHGQFWFSSAHQSQRFRHIRSNPHVSAAHTRGEEISIIIHGTAHVVDTSSGDYEALHQCCLEVYGAGYDEWGFWGKQPYAWIEPSRMYAIRIQHD